jgi:repressor LexA
MATEKQESILAFMRTFQERERVPPSSRQIATAFKFRSQTTAMRHLNALAAEGLVEQLTGGRWSVKHDVRARPDFTDVPVYGSIPAGPPAFREQQPEGVLPVDRRALGVRGELWAVRVKGDSMIGEHIIEGDIAVFEKREVRIGDIIAALVDGTEATLKRYVVEKDRAILRAANPRIDDIYPDKLESQGVFVALFRHPGF